MPSNPPLEEGLKVRGLEDIRGREEDSANFAGGKDCSRERNYIALNGINYRGAWRICKWIACLERGKSGVCFLDGQSRIIREFRAVPKWLMSISTSSPLQGQCEDADENWLRVIEATLEQP